MGALHLTKESFDQEVLSSDKPVLVDFWASWCGPCRMVLPIIEELATELQDVKVYKVNVDEEGELAERYKIMTIPSLLVFKEGKVVNSSVGAKSKTEILNLLQA